MRALGRRRSRARMIVGVCGAILAVFPLSARAQVNGSEVPAAGPAPAYQIRLGPRHAQASPTLTTDSQTGGGFIDVQQTMPNAVVISMRGAAVAGADCKKGASASIAFELDQEFTIVPTRAGLRPPRLGLAARVVGILDSSDKGKGCGSAEQGEACAAVLSAGESLLTVCVPPQAAGGGQKLFLNNRAGPVEVAVVPGCFALRQTFHIAATQSKSLCDKAASAADFDPKPQLDSEWAKPLKAFRAVPRDDFGFRVVLWVVEDTLPAESKKAP